MFHFSEKLGESTQLADEGPSNKGHPTANINSSYSKKFPLGEHFLLLAEHYIRIIQAVAVLVHASRQHTGVSM